MAASVLHRTHQDRTNRFAEVVFWLEVPAKQKITSNKTWQVKCYYPDTQNMLSIWARVSGCPLPSKGTLKIWSLTSLATCWVQTMSDLFMGPTSYFCRGYSPVTKYHGYLSTFPKTSYHCTLHPNTWWEGGLNHARKTYQEMFGGSTTSIGI